MISEQQAIEAVGLMSLCRFFPASDLQRAQIAAILIEMVNTKQELDWLTGVQCKLDWRGPYELRMLLCSRFTPRDRLNFSESAEQSYFEREAAETDRRIAGWKREQKLLGESPLEIDVTPAIKSIDRTTDDLQFERVQGLLGKETKPIHIPATPVRTPEERTALVREMESQLGIEPLPKRFGYCAAFALQPGPEMRFIPNLPVILSQPSENTRP